MKYVSGDVRMLAGKHFCYLAAPFFNEMQLRLVENLESLFENAKVGCFSPRLIHGDKPVPIKTNEQAQAAFTNNYNALVSCRSMLAVVDWLMVPPQEVRVVERQTEELFSSHSGPLNLPDSGTVWELGVAYALGKQIALYTSRPPEAKMNIMLSQGATGVLNSAKAVQDWLQGGQLKPWKGAHT